MWGLSRQATPRDGREARAQKQSPSLPGCLGPESQREALPVRPCHFLGVCMKALAPALRLHTSPLPGGPGAWVICCFFKLAPHPWTVCQEGPLFMRISCWLQLTLRCTILGLCPELFLFFLEAPPPPTAPCFRSTQPHQASFCGPKSLERQAGGMEAKPFSELWSPEHLGEEAGRP